MGKKRQNEKKPEFIKNLPTEILYIIFGEFLEYKEWFKLAQVCSWANFIVTMCWQKVKFLDFDIFPLPRDSEFISVIAKCTKLEKLKLDCYYLSIDAILAFPISITHIKLSSIDNALKNDNFIQSIQRLQNLKSLKFNTLDDYDRYNPNLNEWSQYFKSCKLDEISIGTIYSESLDHDISSFLVGKCKSYKALRLVDSPNIKKFSANLISAKFEAHRNVWNPLGLNDWTFKKLSNECQKLEKLKIIDYNFKLYDEFTSVSFNIIINSWRNLRYLHLSNFTDFGVKSINDLDIMRVATVCRNLKGISLDSFKTITDASISELAINCTELERVSLSFTYITDDSLSALSSLQSLKQLTLRGCRKISERGLSELFESCIGLKYLNLSTASGVSDFSFEKLCSNCQELEELIINDAEITDESVYLLYELRNLKHLVLSYCSGISESFCFREIAKLKKLIDLSLSGNKFLLDEDLVFIIENIGENLQKLRLDACILLTDKSFCKINECAKMLRYLYLKNIVLNEKTLWNLEGLRSLKYIELSKPQDFEFYPTNLEAMVVFD